MRFPIFDGYNMPFENFIRSVEYAGSEVPQPYMQHFIAVILSSLCGEARRIAYQYSYKHYLDLVDLLYDQFCPQRKYKKILQNLRNLLPTYDGYNLSFDEFSYEVCRAAYRTPRSFYELFLDVLIEKLFDEAREIAEDSGFRNHLDLLDNLGRVFDINHTNNSFSDYEYYNCYEDDAIAHADCGVPCIVSTAETKESSNIQSTQNTPPPLVYPEEQTITELEEMSEPLILTLPNKVTIGVTDVISNINNHAIVTQRCVTACQIIVNPSSLECLDKQLQVPNRDCINLEPNTLQLNNYDITEPLISYKATIITEPEIRLENNLVSLNLHKVRTHILPTPIKIEDLIPATPNTLANISVERTFNSCLEIQEPILDYGASFEKVIWTSVESPVVEKAIQRNRPHTHAHQDDNYSYMIPVYTCKDKLLFSLSKILTYFHKRPSFQPENKNGIRLQKPNFKYRKKENLNYNLVV